MSDAHAFDFGKFIPGFDFLQKLATQRPAAGSAVPGLGGWVAPTVSVDELDRRIKELKAVQFWLEQNTTAIKATVQALEVQKMTLATLQGMNLSMAEVAKAFTVPTPEGAAAAPAAPPAGWPYGKAEAAAAPAPAASAPAPEPEAAPTAEPEPEPPAAKPARARPARKPTAKAAAKPAGGAPAGALADPMLWWGALTQQFQQIAANALREGNRAQPEAAAGNTPDATKNEAAGADGVSAGAPKAAKKAVAARKPAAKKSGAKKPATKKPAGRAGAKTEAKAGAKTAAKRASRAPAADRPARSALAGWPLPPPFKLGR